MKPFLSKPALVSCAGTGVESLYKAVVTGRSGVKPGIKPFNTPEGQTFFTARIDTAPLAPPPAPVPDTRFFRIVFNAAGQCRPLLDKARERYGAGRLGLAFGSCDNGSELSLPAHREFFEKGAFPQGYTLEEQGAVLPAKLLAQSLGIEGPAVSIATACASSASAIIQAAELLRAGLCDVVLAGGADLASPLVLQGFGSLEALSDAISNPFSKNRKGINMGEAAAFFLVSREALDDTHIRLLGWGESADAYQQTAPAPDGGGAALAMRRALASAGLEPGAIVYVNLHGTGTGLNDSMEAKAMQQVYGTCIPPCSSTKPIHGHTLGAAGALEAAICWEMLYTCSTKGAIQIPPQRWDGEADPDFPQLPLVKQNAILSQPGACMSNSFAFGGCNASLILGVEND